MQRTWLVWSSLTLMASLPHGSQTERRPSQAPLAPPLPATWVNGPALASEALAGKAVFLAFFEET